MLRTCIVFLYVTAVLTDPEYLEVVTESGPIRGRLQPIQDIYAFYNIPYATAPIGVNRFKAPLPPPKWFKEFEANDEKIVCPQNIKLIKAFLTERVKAQENCLIANVFVPKTPEENLPVLVYVHGGAFATGYGNMIKATKIMKKKDFILVTFNYRLGIHGFLCLGTKDIPGNAGMKDQVALLRWVNQNIANFGGNPREVTIVGSSTGAASVDLLMLSKSAKGLFHRVIPESGGNLAPFAVQRDPLMVARNYAKKLNFTHVNDIKALEQSYKTAPIKLLTSDIFFERTDATFLFSPCVESDTGDGAFLTESPLTILKKGEYDKLPMLYGFTSMEGLMRIDYFDMWKDKMNKNFSNFLPADLKFSSEKEKEKVAQKIKRFYFSNKSIGNKSALSFVEFISDITVTYPMLRAAQLNVKAGNDKVYLYEYAFASEVEGSKVRGADHCSQTSAWLDNLDGHVDTFVSPPYHEMRKKVREIWHNFITTGEPVPKNSTLPKWPPAKFNKTCSLLTPYMVLDEKLELRREPLLEKRTRFWDGIYQKYYWDAIQPTQNRTNITTTTPASTHRRKHSYVTSRNLISHLFQYKSR